MRNELALINFLRVAITIMIKTIVSMLRIEI